MKKFFAIIMSVALTISVIMPVSVYASTNISVTIDGNKVNFDVQPQIINGRTMVPMRAIFKEFGMKVTWDDVFKTVTASKDNDSIQMRVGSKTFFKNDEIKTLDTPAVIINSRTLVPVRAIAESLDANVVWDNVNKIVKITTGSKPAYYSDWYGVPDFGAKFGVTPVYENDGLYAYSATELENVGAYHDSASKYTGLLENEGFIFIQKFTDDDGAPVLLYQKNDILVYYSATMLGDKACIIVVVMHSSEIE